VSKGFLKDEWERALAGEFTQDCRRGPCHQCGVCDFETVAPITFDPESVGRSHGGSQDVNPNNTFKKLKLCYEKRGQARLFGHLEMVKIFMRAFRRVQIPLRFSEGFHPVPKFSFHCALPVGIESTREHFTVEVPLFVQPTSVMARVNKKKFQYKVRLKDETFPKSNLQAFLGCSRWILERKNKKGRIRTVDLKAVVTELRMLSSDTIQMTLDVSSGIHVRPTEVLKEVFCLDERTLKLASILKEPLSQAQ